MSCCSHAACCKPGPPSSAQPLGEETKYGDLDVYVNGSTSSEAAVLFITDVFGYEVPLTRAIADKVAAAGYLAVLPDIIHGDPLDRNKTTFPDWLSKHPVDVAIKEAEMVIQKLSERGIKRIGVVGFCWGAKIAVALSVSGTVQAAVLNHPSLVTLEDVKAVKAATAILSAESDTITTKEMAEQFRAALAADPALAPKSMVKLFSGVAHGWTVRYDTNSKEEVAKAEEAHKDMLDWFSKYL